MVSLARAIAAQQLLPSATCLSHTSAALIHGLAMWTGEPDVYLAVSGHPRLTTTTLPAFRYPSSGLPAPIEATPSEAAPVRMHRRRLQLRDGEIEVVGGVPVTSVLRTAFDCACDEPSHNALSIADAALNRYCRPDPWHRDSCATRLRSSHACWEELMARHRGRRGIEQARAVLAAATPWAVSPGESVLRWMTLVVGLPEAIAQYPVPGLSKDRFLDLGWPDHRVVAEFDGRIKYHSEEDVFLEKLRQDELESLGWRFFRATWSSLSDMRTQADRLLAVFPWRWSPVSHRQSSFKVVDCGASVRLECWSREVTAPDVASWPIDRIHRRRRRTSGSATAFSPKSLEAELSHLRDIAVLDAHVRPRSPPAGLGPSPTPLKRADAGQRRGSPERNRVPPTSRWTGPGDAASPAAGGPQAASSSGERLT